jgi:hypothetical protein
MYRYFTGNALCNSDDCHATLSHFALFHDKNCLLQTPSRKIPEESNLENKGTRVIGDTFRAMMEKTVCATSLWEQFSC